MTNLLPIEEDILKTYNLPTPSPAFLNELSQKFRENFPNPAPSLSRPPKLAWAGLSILLIILLIVSILGPQKVLAQIQTWLGILPSIGLVESDTPIRTLKQPVSLTIDGITLTVQDATLTPLKTIINVGMEGIPRSAYPKDETITGCSEPQYLMDGEGNQIEAKGDNEYFPVPSDIHQLTLVYPCLWNTLPGSVPTDWRLPLEFVDLEEPLALTPVHILDTATPEAQAATPSQDTANELVITHVVVEDGSLILAGYIPNAPERVRPLIDGLQVIDAEGKRVSFSRDAGLTPVMDLVYSQPGAFAFRIDSSNVSFPIEIRMGYPKLSPPLLDEQTSLTFTLPDDYFVLDQEINQTFEIAGEKLEIYSVRAQPSQFEGYIYDFFILEHPVIKSIRVELPGSDRPLLATDYVGSGPMFGKRVITASTIVEEGPLHGEQTFTFYAPVKALDWIEFSQSYSPDDLILAQLEASVSTQQACLSNFDLESKLDAARQLPEGLAFIQQVVAPTKYGHVLYDLVSGQEILSCGSCAWSSIAPSGKQIAYFDENDDLVIRDLETRETKAIFHGKAYQPIWSPDGQWIAFYQIGEENEGGMLIKPDGSGLTEIPQRGYGGLLGWSDDSQRFYFKLVVGSGERGVLYVYDLASGLAERSNLISESDFISSSFGLSRDEKQIMNRDQSDNWLWEDLETGETKVLTKGIANYNAFWINQDWILINTMDEEVLSAGQALLLNPRTCEAFQLPDGMKGTVTSIWLE